MAVSRKTWLMLSAAAMMAPHAAEAQPKTRQALLSADETATGSPQATGPSQEPTPAQGSAQSGSSTEPQSTGLQDIVVTAQQRGENLQKAAVPVAVVTGADLLASGVRGIDTLGKLVPSLVVAAGGQGNLIFIRGVGNFSFVASSDPAAAFNYDGVYTGR